MPKNNRECKVCGSKYHYCPTCSSDISKPKWMNMFDTEKCHTIFSVATQFNMGKINRLEAKNMLSGIDLSDRGKLSEQIQIDLANIYKNKNKSHKKETAVVEQPSVEQVVEDVVAVPVVISEPVIAEDIQVVI